MIPMEGPAGQALLAGGASTGVADGRATAASASDQRVPRLRGVSHAVASVAAVAAAAAVVALAPTVRTIVPLAVYGVGLVALFCGSALYHRWPGPARFRSLLQRIDSFSNGSPLSRSSCWVPGACSIPPGRSCTRRSDRTLGRERSASMRYSTRS